MPGTPVCQSPEVTKLKTEIQYWNSPHTLTNSVLEFIYEHFGKKHIIGCYS